MFFVAATEDATTAAAAVSAVGAFWTAMKPYMVTAVAYTTIAQVDFINVNGQHTGAANTTPSTGSGTGAGNMLPAAVQMLTQWRTGTYINSREVRGRTFIPGVASLTLTATGVPSAATLAAVQTACNTLIGNATAHLNIWDRTHAGSSQVVTGSPWSQYAVLRSRRD
jgi:hypothetical protein